MAKRLQELWQDPWFDQYQDDIRITVNHFYMRRFVWCKKLGVEVDDLYAGVFLRLLRLRERIANGEYKPDLAKERTWIVPQIKWGMEDLMRSYSWSSPVVIRKQLHEYVQDPNGDLETLYQRVDDPEILFKYRETPADCDPVEEVWQKEVMAVLRDRIKEMPDRTQKIIYLYFYCGVTLADIGAKIDISESRVSQIVKRAIRDLRRHVAFKGLVEGEESQTGPCVRNQNRCQPDSHSSVYLSQLGGCYAR